MSSHKIISHKQQLPYLAGCTAAGTPIGGVPRGGGGGCICLVEKK